jgi:hypothetical protein
MIKQLSKDINVINLDEHSFEDTQKLLQETQ